MKQRIAICCTLATLLVTPSTPYATDLVQVYQTALLRNPSFKKAHADWLSAKENLPIAMTGTGQTGSGLFPYASFNAIANRSYNKTVSGNTPTKNGHFGVGNYTLTVTQPIFNYATWEAIKGAGFLVKSATATYLYAAQTLMFTTGEAYFTVLRNYNNLQIIHAKKVNLLELLDIAKHRYKIGMEPITDVYDVRSRYYRTLTEEQEAEQALKESIETLQAVTGVKYVILKDLSKKIPLVLPWPQSQAAWVRTAIAQNYLIHAELYAMLAAHEKIKETSGAGWPTLNAYTEFESLDEGRMRGDIPHNRRITRTNQVGLELNFPILQGGHTFVTARQAEYNYLAANDQLNVARYEIRKTAAQAFIQIDQGIQQIQSGHKAILESQKDLKAAKVSYLVGNRSMLDVVIDIQQLYDTMLTWNNNRNEYVINLMQLKLQAGTLSPKDLEKINRWLSKNVTFENSLSPSVVRHFKTDRKLEQALINSQLLNKPNKPKTSPQPIKPSNKKPSPKVSLPPPATSLSHQLPSPISTKKLYQPNERQQPLRMTLPSPAVTHQPLKIYYGKKIMTG